MDFSFQQPTAAGERHPKPGFQLLLQLKKAIIVPIGRKVEPPACRPLAIDKAGRAEPLGGEISQKIEKYLRNSSTLALRIPSLQPVSAKSFPVGLAWNAAVEVYGADIRPPQPTAGAADGEHLV